MITELGNVAEETQDTFIPGGLDERHFELRG